jgi:peroxiredoxin-like protein
MQAFPHKYTVTANTFTDGATQVSSTNLPSLLCAPPEEFGGPGDQWSPETLLVAAIADCFLLSFKAIARASKLDWDALSCEVVGTLDKLDRITQFTEFQLHAELTLPADGNEDKARRLLDKAEQVCLISNSLKGDCHLSSSVLMADQNLTCAPISTTSNAELSSS